MPLPKDPLMKAVNDMYFMWTNCEACDGPGAVEHILCAEHEWLVWPIIEAVSNGHALPLKETNVE